MVERTGPRTGIEFVGNLPWGSHICMFYETPQDLIDIEGLYFGAGLAAGEFCVCALSGPVDREAIIAGLRRSIPDFDRHLEGGHIEFMPGYKWRLRGDEIDPQRIARGWAAKLAEALAKGFTGMRAAGNALWIEDHPWKDFEEYEVELGRMMEGRRMIALCTYLLSATNSLDVLDVARAHHFAIARRHGRWEYFVAPDLIAAEQEPAAPRRAGEAPSRVDIADSWPLTPRERVVLAQIIKGASAKESARALGISPRTVEFHRANIMQKLGARNLADLLNKVYSD